MNRELDASMGDAERRPRKVLRAKRRMFTEATPLTRFSLPALVGVVVALSMTVQVSADASPPLYPPGSAVLPPGETMVQMVAETVDITVVASPTRAQFEATFAMRNQGSATEQMDARFPLTDADSWETIWDFAAYVNGQRVRVRKSVEPFALGDPRIARWAVFPVTFEPGVDVEIMVTYSTSISGWGWSDRHGVVDSIDSAEEAFIGPMDPDTATVYYTLETGAGWYGPIGKGTVVLRLPYEAGPANVFDLDAGLAEGRYGGFGSGSGEGLSGPSFADNEARWEFANLEPTAEQNLSLQFLWPKEWQRILTLQAAADRSPADAAASLQLAGAYLAAGADVQNGFANEYHCRLSLREVERGLGYHPSSEELLEGLGIIAGFCPDVSTSSEQVTATLTSMTTSTSPSPIPIPSSSSTALPTVALSPTDEAKLPTVTTAPTGPTDGARLPTATAAPTSGVRSSPAGVQALIGIGLGVIVALIVVAVGRRRTSR